MIQNDNGNNKIKENKYKILRMSLLLGNGEDKEETIKNFEDASREIDAMNDEIYAKDLEGKFYDTLKLEEEEKKLAALVDCIGGRVEQRMSLIEDFSNVTGYELTNLPEIKYSDKLEEYKNRLFYIREYLDNTKKIEDLTKEIDSLENELNSAYVNKAKAEEQNKKDEEEISNRFNIIVKRKEEFNEINQENADIKLEDIKKETEESKNSLEIFKKSYATLEQAGITGDEKEEYLSYVNGAKKAYYKNKELEYLLELFIIFNEKKTDYNQIVSKRNTINDILSERLSLREELKVEKEDCLYNIYSILDRQYTEINEQKENIDKIERLNSEIENCKELTKELEKDNQKVEILSLLKEFCIIDTYDEDLKDDEYNEKENDLDIDSEEPTIEDSPDTDDETTSIEPPTENEDQIEENDLTPDIEPSESEEEIAPESELNFDPEPETEETDIIPEETNIIDDSNVEDNQVISVSEADKINIQEAIEKSNSVMRRVGEMLGVKIETPSEPKETPEETTPTEEPATATTTEEPKPEETTSEPEETPVAEPAVEEPSPEPAEESVSTIPEDNNLPFEPEPEPTTPEEETQPTSETPESVSEPADFDIDSNIFLNNNYDADPETNMENNTQTQTSTPEPTPAPTPQENPLFNSELANKTLDDVMANNQNIVDNADNKNDDFWFSQEEKPLDLNSLPDIDSTPNQPEAQNNMFFGNGEAQTLDFPNLEEQVPIPTETPAETTAEAPAPAAPTETAEKEEA